MDALPQSIPADARLEHGVRASLASCLGILFEAPKDWPDGVIDRLAAALPPLPFALRHAGAELVRQLEPLWPSTELALGHARLFLGPIEILAPPYASSYLEGDGRLMGPVSEGVAQQYREAGLIQAQGPREAPDHVSRELEFYAYLLAECARSGDGSWELRLRRFHLHAYSWWPQLAARIEGAAQLHALRQLGHLLALFCESEAARLELPPR